jgi:hypothetical protein
MLIGLCRELGIAKVLVRFQLVAITVSFHSLPLIESYGTSFPLDEMNEQYEYLKSIIYSIINHPLFY